MYVLFENNIESFAVLDVVYFSAKRRKISVMTLTKETDACCGVKQVIHASRLSGE